MCPERLCLNTLSLHLCSLSLRDIGLRGLWAEPVWHCLHSCSALLQMPEVLPHIAAFSSSKAPQSSPAAPSAGPEVIRSRSSC